MFIETRGHGPALALIHGWAMHGGLFAPLVDRLADRYTLHLVDLPGHGHARAGRHAAGAGSARRRLVARVPERGMAGLVAGRAVRAARGAGSSARRAWPDHDRVLAALRRRRRLAARRRRAVVPRFRRGAGEGFPRHAGRVPCAGSAGLGARAGRTAQPACAGVRTRRTRCARAARRSALARSPRRALRTADAARAEPVALRPPRPSGAGRRDAGCRGTGAGCAQRGDPQRRARAVPWRGRCRWREMWTDSCNWLSPT